jgi:hypothetical protein
VAFPRRFSKARKISGKKFQALEKNSANLSNAWKKHRVHFPMLGNLAAARGTVAFLLCGLLLWAGLSSPANASAREL